MRESERETVPGLQDLQRQLVYYRDQYQALLEQVPVAVFVIDPREGRLIDANRIACELLGYSREELLSRVRSSDIHPHDMDVFERFKDEVFRSGVGHTEKLSCMTSSGRVVPIEVSAEVVHRNGRQLLRVVATDIRAQKALEQALEDELRGRYETSEIIGRSAAWKEVMAQVDLVAGTDSTVLISGDTGTGKELVCRAIHQRSRRRDRPLIRLNCAAIPAALAESELFGHEKGAFTGAFALKRGRFEHAHEGTLFLDEIGDLPLEIQPKLLRVLQEKEYERVGASRPLRVDTRLVVATHRDLASMSREGKFREDLLYRINVFPVRLPSLRKRREDIPLLAGYFVRRVCERLGKPIAQITDRAIARLVEYGWPGNVRELENVVERAWILSRGGPIDVEHVHLESATSTSAVRLDEVEKQHIRRTLEVTGWKVSGTEGAAKLLGLKPSTLNSRMKKLGINRPRDVV